MTVERSKRRSLLALTFIAKSEYYFKLYSNIAITYNVKSCGCPFTKISLSFGNKPMHYKYFAAKSFTEKVRLKAINIITSVL